MKVIDTETDVLRMLLARRDNYAVVGITPIRGRVYDVEIGNEHYNAVVLISSFEFYEKRYHIAEMLPTLVICFEHNTVLPIPVLSMRAGNLAKPYELPQEITDVEAQRHTKLGSQVLLGMYISGVKVAQTIINQLPESTRLRYLWRVKTLNKRKRGKPVGLQAAS
jgi:hypothetical protein